MYLKKGVCRGVGGEGETEMPIQVFLVDKYLNWAVVTSHNGGYVDHISTNPTRTIFCHNYLLILDMAINFVQVPTGIVSASLYQKKAIPKKISTQVLLGIFFGL